MSIIKIIRGESEIFTPNRKGKGFVYTRHGNSQTYDHKTWEEAVKSLSNQKFISIFYDKPFNRADWM